MLCGQMQDQRPLPGDEAHVHPHQRVKDPPRCRLLSRGALLVRKGGAVGLEGRAKALLQRRLDAPADRHHPQERHAPRRRFARPRRGQHAWSFAETNATFRLHWAFVAREQRLGRELGRVKVGGGQQDTTRWSDECLTSSDP